MKLGPQHYPIHQWKLAGKEKRGGEKEGHVRKRNASQVQCRHFQCILTTDSYRLEHWGRYLKRCRQCGHYHSPWWHLLGNVLFRDKRDSMLACFVYVAHIKPHSSLNQEPKVHLCILLQTWEHELSCEQVPIPQSRTRFFPRGWGRAECKTHDHQVSSA